MPALKVSTYRGEITWLGVTPHRNRSELDTAAIPQMSLSYAGYVDDCHSGVTRPACSRVAALHPKGTEIRNTRQLSILSQEELDQMKDELGLERLNPEWLGASLVLSGIPDFSHLTPSSRLQGSDGCTLVIDLLNHPCRYPAMTIVEHLGPQGSGFNRAFKDAAQTRRGVTAWVERPGTLSLGESMRLFIPTQRAWQV